MASLHQQVTAPALTALMSSPPPAQLWSDRQAPEAWQLVTGVARVLVEFQNLLLAEEEGLLDVLAAGLLPPKTLEAVARLVHWLQSHPQQLHPDAPHNRGRTIGLMEVWGLSHNLVYHVIKAPTSGQQPYQAQMALQMQASGVCRRWARSCIWHQRHAARHAAAVSIVL
jgi:hypothetical protein